MSAARNRKEGAGPAKPAEAPTRTPEEVLEELRPKSNPLLQLTDKKREFVVSKVLDEGEDVLWVANPHVGWDYYLGWGVLYLVLTLLLIGLPLIVVFRFPGARASLPVLWVALCAWVTLSISWANSHRSIMRSTYVLCETRLVRVMWKSQPRVLSVPLYSVSGMKIDADMEGFGHIVFNAVQLPRSTEPAGPTNRYYVQQHGCWHVKDCRSFFKVMRVLNIIAKRGERAANLAAMEGEGAVADDDAALGVVPAAGAASESDGGGKKEA